MSLRPSPAELRLIVDPQLPGARNMAADAALLRWAAHSPPTLRLYGFSPACLSLGRFQALEDISENAARERSVDIVRRPTGGKAVLHDHEVTFALVLGRHQLQPFTKRGAFRVAADLVVHLVEVLGVQAGTGVGVEAPARSVTPDCFQTTASFEIVASGRKIVGSAQTTTREGSLQHGSLPLSAGYRSIAKLLARPTLGQLPQGAQPQTDAGRAPSPPTSVEEETGHRWSFVAARDALAGRLTERGVADWITGVIVDTLSADEERTAEQLEHERFGTRAWTERSRHGIGT